jgi:hypothetical protein
MAVYKHVVNAGDHCGLQARIIDLQNTHKKMRLRILSLLKQIVAHVEATTQNRVMRFIPGNAHVEGLSI